jgi:membrane-bound metal-dependent hydrolase YbcI (DUF457 family)
MASPIAHGLAGLTVHLLATGRGDGLRDRGRAACVVIAALAPDADLLLCLVDGRNHHNNEVHSIGFAILAAVVAAATARLLGWARPLALGLAAGAAWLSHLLLDYLNRDTNPPIGLMALWPLDSGHYNFPWPLFLDVGRTLTWATLWHNAVAVTWELVILLPLVLIVGRRSFRA